MANYYSKCFICINSLYLHKTSMNLVLLIPLFTGEDIEAREVLEPGECVAGTWRWVRL